MKVSRVSEMRAMDRSAIDQFGISAELLMENAGHAVYYALRKEFGIRDKRFLIFCGLGNNGGDGMVLARKIHANGGDVQVVLLANSDKYRGPARTNFEIISRLP
jgi:NAD(P)H-hydrate epimerase